LVNPLVLLIIVPEPGLSLLADGPNHRQIAGWTSAEIWLTLGVVVGVAGELPPSERLQDAGAVEHQRAQYMEQSG